MRRTAFLALFADIGIDAPDRALRVSAKLPFGDLMSLFEAVGTPTPTPPGEDAPFPGMLIAPCRRPVHPETEEACLAEAALAVLERLVAAEAGPVALPFAQRVYALWREVGSRAVPVPAHGAGDGL